MTFEEWCDEEKKNGRLKYTLPEFRDFGYDIAKRAWEAAYQEGLKDGAKMTTEAAWGNEQKKLKAYRKYVENNLERISYGGWTPICYNEFLTSEELETYLDDIYTSRL